MNGNNERNYGIDLLKIILAFMVLTLHFNATGTGKVIMYSSVTPWKWLVGGITTLCYPAVNCYVLISGYFFYKQKNDLKKQVYSLSKLWLTILFYSIMGYLCLAIFNNSFNFGEFLLRFFPISRGKWWFFTVYFGISIMSPFINTMLIGLDKKNRKMQLFLLLIICSIVPMFTNWNEQLGSNYGYSLLWFFVLYVTGAYIAEYVEEKVTDKNRKNVALGSIVFFFVISAFIYCSSPLLRKIGIEVSLSPYNSIFTYVQGISLFMFFMNIKVEKVFRTIIANISTLSLAVYMFHCQEDIESVLWSNLEPWKYANNEKLLVVFTATILSLYCGSVVIEYVRRKLAGIGEIDKKITNIINVMFNSIYEKL